jgi:DNA-binding HxlR family transcriptional regulator
MAHSSPPAAATPAAVEYELTDLGRDACVSLGGLLHWVEDNIERFPAIP